MLERAHVARPEARRPRQPAVDLRPERRQRRRFAQRLLEQRNRTVDALELGEQEQRIGPQRRVRRLRQHVRHHRARARPLTGGALRVGRREPTTETVGAALRRRQPKGLFGELGRSERRAAGLRESSRSRPARRRCRHPARRPRAPGGVRDRPGRRRALQAARGHRAVARATRSGRAPTRAAGG